MASRTGRRWSLRRLESRHTGSTLLRSRAGNGTPESGSRVAAEPQTDLRLLHAFGRGLPKDWPALGTDSRRREIPIVPGTPEGGKLPKAHDPAEGGVTDWKRPARAWAVLLAGG